jgi:hypothetical protein
LDKAKTGQAPLRNKAEAIARLAVGPGDFPGKEIFCDYLNLLRTRDRLETLIPDKAKRTAWLIEKQLGGKDMFENHVMQVNQWLEDIGRPNLKITSDELIKIILEVH